MSWFQKILPPKIKRRQEARKSVPEGLWSKCPACNEVLYKADLENNLEVCPKCSYHHRIGARERLDGPKNPKNLLLGELQAVDFL
jgi:acetyl-CoA carboxylase carboxyl transferase subunit beta